MIDAAMIHARTLRIAAAATSAAVLAAMGCASNEVSSRAALAPEPGENMVFADTTQPVRDFPQSTSYIQNGDALGGSTGFRYRSYDDVNVGVAPLVEPGVFIANVVTLPYTLITQRGERVSSGLQFPPSHTQMPALPQSAAPDVTTPPTHPDAVPGVDSSPTDVATTLPADATTQDAPPSSVLSRTGSDVNAPAFMVAGQVQRPGTYDVMNLKLSEVVKAAGPSTEDPAKVRVQIDRPGEESASTTLAELISGAVDDIVIRQGDVVTVSVLP